ncbi:MAG: ABC transporter ATP-binding protein [Clostridia bacterium]|nr:ABC transporter ATP-binding protein [Clostridia bacterium]
MQKKAVQVLKKELPVFTADKLDERACRAAASRASEAVEKAIDPLRLNKDNQSYVFKSSVKANLDRYFKGVEHNPKEQKRFDRDTVKYNKLVARGKHADSVVPINLIDLGVAQRNIVNAIEQLIASYESVVAGTGRQNYAQAAADMIEYLKARASDYAYTLSMEMARHRAIELMKEVGIPEPHKRFNQYPFELSGGMRQRIVIAIALSANPDILICDEPTTALDVTIQAQILELINRLKVERKLSVIFITHDLGVVANMADRIAIMYAGKIVEYGTADDVFYDPRHPYTWALLSSMPDLETKEKLDAIPGTPPNMIIPPKGDAFAARNHYAMQIDFEQQPPMFQISETHQAATWLLHPNAPKVEPPAIVRERIARMQNKQQATAEVEA